MTSRIDKPDTETDLALYERLDNNERVRHFIMIAGAGSGKTTSLIKALAYISKSQGAGFVRQGQQIACITYTDIAVEEIRKDVGHDDLFHISTIHSFLWYLIKPFQADIKEWVIGRLDEKIIEQEEKLANTRTRPATKEKAAEAITRYRQTIAMLDSVSSFRYGTGSDYANGILGHSDILAIGPMLICSHPLMRKVLGQRFPVVFVDESQDTDPAFVEALRAVAKDKPLGFCLGFFGDPVQKIYMQGAGKIKKEEDWAEFKKPENFRCPQSVLKVINKIRAEDDRLAQIRGRHEEIEGEEVPIGGSARVLILPSDDQRQERLEAARAWLAEQDDDPAWIDNDDSVDLRMLVLVHRMAANRLGFPNLYASLNDKSPENLKSGVVDGTAWVLRPFLNFLLPLIASDQERQDFQVMRILGKHCPKLQPEFLVGKRHADVLKELRKDIAQLHEMFSLESTASIGDVVRELHDRNFAALDERFISLQAEYARADPVAEPTIENAALRFMQCPASELWGYRHYIEDLSPFKTQQGIKGAEFEKVLVVIDDVEGKTNTFSYGKYFGVKALSDRDKKNLDEGKDSVVDRTRRLFYVCCSRALTDLAVVIFADDVEQTKSAILAKSFFEDDCVHTLDLEVG